MANQTIDPFRVYSFRVKVNGIDKDQFYFTKCSAFSVTVENQTYREADNEPLTHQIPNRVKYDPITLSYGVTKSQALWDWLMNTAAGKVERKNVSIEILNSDGSTVKAKYELSNAWPQKCEGYEIDAASGEMAIAQLTLVYDQLNRKQS